MRMSYFPLAVALCVSCFGNAATARCADLSLVLAIDSSGRIDADEFALQNLGYAAAFQSHAVKRAIAATGVVDVAAVYWGDADFAFQTIPWYRLNSPQDADNFAELILSIPRRAIGDTDIGNGLNLAIDMLADPSRCSFRSIVNVSGDGQESVSAKRTIRIPLAVAHARAKEFGIIVNGLAIENETSGLTQYYVEKLISGPGSFVIGVKDFTTFGPAIEQKLTREISPSLSASLDLVPNP